MVAPADGHNTTGQIDPAVHGHMGPLQISIQEFPSPVDKQTIETTKELSEFPFVLDMNAGYPIGIGESPATLLHRMLR